MLILNAYYCVTAYENAHIQMMDRVQNSFALCTIMPEAWAKEIDVS